MICRRSENATKYTYVGSDKDLACSIGYAQSGKIYIQVKIKYLFGPFVIIDHRSKFDQTISNE
jgi:hypothetical protein